MSKLSHVIHLRIIEFSISSISGECASATLPLSGTVIRILYMPIYTTTCLIIGMMGLQI